MQMSRTTQKEQLFEEIKGLRQRVSELENSETQNVRLIEALEKENYRKQKYLDIAGVILAVINTDYNVTFINKKGSEVLGKKVEEIVGKNWFDNFVPERDRDRVKAYFAELTAGNVDLGKCFENPVLMKNGGERIIAWHNPVLKDDDNIIGTLSYGEDVTERRLAEISLRESQELYQKLIQQSVEAVYMFDPETGRILEANNAFLDFLGYTKEELSTLSVYDFVVDQRENINAYVYQILMSGATTIGERLWRCKDKTLIDVQVTANKIFHQGKDICFAIARDITEQKRTETALQESRGKLDAMLHAISDHISMIDKDFNILWVNEPVKKTFGNDIVGKRCYEVFHKRNAPCEPYPCHTVCAFQDGKIHDNDQATDKDGKILYFHCTANVALRDKRGKPAAVLEVSRNITEQKQTENELRVAKERLETLSKSLLETLENERRYIARELHDEIGQKLTAIRMNLETMQHSSNSQKRQNSTKENITIVESLFQQVRNLSLNLRPSILDDLGLIPALRWYASRIEREAEITIRHIEDFVDYRPSREIETACFRVIQETLTNVMRHAKARQVIVELRHNENELKLSIADDGVGFDVKSAQERAVRGESFGLLGMQERVMLLGGTIKIESVQSGGTKVKACFPIR
jgi:PAS domain S-box-containing protein